MEKQEQLLQLERSKNLETINRMQLTKSMFEEQKKTLEAENARLCQLCEQLDLNAQEMSNTVKSQQQQLTKKNDELIGMEEEMREIRMRNEEITCNYQKIIASLKAELLQRIGHCDELEAKLEELDAHHKDLQEQLSAASTKIQKLTDENNMLQDHLRKANNEIQKENLEKQANQEKLIDAKQVMTSLKEKMDDLNLSHSKEVNLLKQTVADLENIVARKDDIIMEQQNEISKIKCYIHALQGEMANITEQARLEREKHKTLYEKAGLLSEFLDKSSASLTEKQEEVWALKQQLETSRKLSPILEESDVSQTTYQGISDLTSRKEEPKRTVSSDRISEESTSYNIEELKEELKFKEHCMQELTNTVIKIGLEAKQREAELEQEILQLKSIINMKESMLSYQEKQLSKAQYELSINKAILRETDITVHQKEIELERERKKSKEVTPEKESETPDKNKSEMQEPLRLSSVEKSENIDELESIDSQGSCLIYESEFKSLKEITKKGTENRKDNYPMTSTPSKLQEEITMQRNLATKIVKDVEEPSENPPRPQSPADSDIPSQPACQRSLEINNKSVKIKSKNINR